MDKQELNEVCKQIEMAIRTHSENPKRRFGSIRAELIREAMIKYRIGLVCESCLLDPKSKSARIHAHYCCSDHSSYYKPIVRRFYFGAKPYRGRGKGDSIDHILPIANGGLEFDRDNVQWMDLKENIRKSGGKRYTRRVEQKPIGFINLDAAVRTGAK